MLASVDGADSVTGALLELQLSQIRLECEGTARQRNAFRHNLELKQIPTNFGLWACLSDSGLLTRLNLKHEIRKQPQPDICVNPVILISFSDSIPSKL